MTKISVSESFAYKTVLITGASGELGKILLEKLMFDVDEIASIYILFRSKRENSFQERFEKFKMSATFERVKTKNPKLLDKIKPINADLNFSPNLGIAKHDLKMLRKEVNIIFHLAATIKFNEPIQAALKLNMVATHDLLEMAKTFDRLEIFVYVSTAFSNVQLSNIEEKIHNPLYDYKEALEATRNEDRNKLSKIEKIALAHFPNTYTFSKHLTEHLVNDFSSEIPIVIIRPSIVTPSYREPFDGWNDNIKNYMSIGVAIAYGLVRVLPSHPNPKRLDFVPNDFVTSAMLISAAQGISYGEDKSLKVINCSFGKQFPVTQKKMAEDGLKISLESLPSEKMIWYPHIIFTSNYSVYLLRFLLFQMLPAIFIDFVLIIINKKPYLVKIQKAIFKAVRSFEFFFLNDWTFENDNFVRLYENLRDGEK